MGNVQSDDEDNNHQDGRAGSFLQEGFNLESPDADQTINFGTAAPVWQNNNDNQDDDDDDVEEGQEVVMDSGDAENSDSQQQRQQTPEGGTPIDPKKLSYVQMARLGYQELINAIIRPPRADYKVSKSRVCMNDSLFVFFTKRLVHSFTHYLFFFFCNCVLFIYIRWNN